MIFNPDKVKFRYFAWKTKSKEKRRFSRWITINKLEVTEHHRCAYSALTIYMAAQRTNYKKGKLETPWVAFSTKTDLGKKQLAVNAKQVMMLAGVDAQFDSDSIRHAVISYWRRKKVSKRHVMERTGHRSASLVDFFYDRSPNDEDIIARLIGDNGASSDEPLEEEDSSSDEFDEEDDSHSCEIDEQSSGELSIPVASNQEAEGESSPR